MYFKSQNRAVIFAVGVLMGTSVVLSAPESARNNHEDSSGSFSSIFGAISDAGRASVNAIMGTPSNQGHALSRTSKQSRRKMNGFDVRKLKVMGPGGRGDQDFILTTPRVMGAGPTHFSDLVDILHNGQRQGVVVFRGGSGLSLSSPRPPLASLVSATPTAATDRTFFSDPVPSPFPFDRKVHQRQGLFNNRPPQPSSFAAAPPPTLSSTFPTAPSFANSFQPNQPLSFAGGGSSGSNFNSARPTSSFSATPTLSSNALKFPEETTINQIINSLGQQSGLAVQPEKLMIHVVEQQNLGSPLKTSNGPVEQVRFVSQVEKKRKRKKKNKKKKNKPAVVENAQELVEELRRQGKNAKGPSISFITAANEPIQTRQTLSSNSNLAFRTGRQTNTDKVVVPGFPNGLPNGVPEGVKIALASAERGPDGEFIMNPIPGQAGVDFPVLASVPDTGFDCGLQQFPGIYGDIDADCQVFHMCQPNGNYDSFLCPNGTIFNQQYFICDWWYNVDCAASNNFYALNEFIYQDQEEGKNCQSLFCIDD